MLLLTNCTFDGIVYNVERVMEECLAIKPDLVFLWDEAWFAFARFGPTYRQRTGMNAANNLRDRLKSTPAHAKAYAKQQETLKDADEATLLKTRLIPPPECARARLRHPIDAQDADLAASGLDDPCQRSGLQRRGRTGLPRSLHDPHLDLARTTRSSPRWTSAAVRWNWKGSNSSSARSRPRCRCAGPSPPIRSCRSISRC